MNIELKKEDIEFLILLLEREYKSALVEEHHTAHQEYRKIVKAKIDEIENLIGQFKKAT